MEKRIRHIGIIGSTGSIGTQTLDIVRSNDDLKVEILSCAGNNLDLFEKQVREFMPKKVCVWQEAAAKDFADRIKDLQVQVVSGMDGLIEVSTYENMEILVTAVVGMIGIRPTIEAIKAGKDIALANKETLVAAGKLVMDSAKESKTTKKTTTKKADGETAAKKPAAKKTTMPINMYSAINQSPPILFFRICYINF